MRDCKIASLYEGTNGIQALDLVGRKLAYKQGLLMKNGMKAVGKVLAPWREDYSLHELFKIYDEAQESLIQVTKFFALKSITEDFNVPVLYAKPYLDLFGDVVIGFLLLWQAGIAAKKLEEIYAEQGAHDEAARTKLLNENRGAAFYFGKVASARFFINQVLTEATGKARGIMNGDKAALELPELGFAAD